MIVVGEDTMAGGAYMTVVAGDEIYVNRSTITDSIGALCHRLIFLNSLTNMELNVIS